MFKHVIDNIRFFEKWQLGNHYGMYEPSELQAFAVNALSANWKRSEEALIESYRDIVRDAVHDGNLNDKFIQNVLAEVNQELRRLYAQADEAYYDAPLAAEFGPQGLEQNQAA